MPELILYSTECCHLCREAQRVIHEVLGISVAEVDIADDDRLLERYGIRIPVLQRLDTGAEISWPFAAEEVAALLR